MSLINALQIGRSGLAANQAAIQIAGNNLANAANPGYTRQSAHLAAATPVGMDPGKFIGTGVRLDAIIRNVDSALDARIRNAVSDSRGALAQQDLLSQIESIYADFSETGLSSRLTEFFSAFSELANDPSEGALKTLAIQQGASLAQSISAIQSDLVHARTQLDNQVRGAVSQANALLDQIAGLNSQIISTEGGLGGAHHLRDERDQLINQLAELIDVQTVEQTSGSTDILVGSTPVLLAAENRGLSVDYTSDESTGELDIRVRIAADGTYLAPTAGRIGALIDARQTHLTDALNTVDQFAGSLIYQVNRLHSQGQGSSYLSDATGAYTTDDSSASLTLAGAGLDFVPENGTFKIHVHQLSSGSTVSSQIDVDLDGIGGPDASLDDIAALVDAVANVSASVTVDGRLRIAADSADFQFSFSDDSSGALAALGINVFFTGSNGTDIAVSQDLINDPSLLATTANHVTGGNATALALAALGDQPLDDLGGLSLNDTWSRHIEDFAVRTQQAGLAADSTAVVTDSLRSQRESISGVSTDEEAINLLAYQRAYQGSARFLNVVDELMQTLLSLVN